MAPVYRCGKKTSRDNKLFDVTKLDDVILQSLNPGLSDSKVQAYNHCIEVALVCMVCINCSRNKIRNKFIRKQE